MAERHLVIRVTTDQRAAAQRARLIEEISAAIDSFESEDDHDFQTVLDWTWWTEDGD